MKSTVYNTMIGLMLVCGLAITSTGAMAQGRRPATNNNAAAAGNRSVATAPKNNAATVTNNNNNVSSRSSVTTSAPQVNRGTTTTGNNSTSGNRSSSTSVRPSVGGSNGSSTTGTTNRNNGSSSTSTNVRPSTGGNHGNGSSTIINANAGNRSSNSGNSNVRNSNSNGNVRPSTGNSSNNGGSVRPSTGNNNGQGHSNPPTSRPSTTPRPKVGGTVMSGGGPHIDYSTYRYTTNSRPRFAGDRFFNSYRYNSWSWTNPIRPSVRPWRPNIWVYRPIVSVNISRYSSYPTIAGVLGLTWGTSFSNALNYLYYNGYYIDGFMDNIVYLTDVELLSYDWDDVMMQFDGNDRFDYIQFASWSESYDTSRFYNLYHYLCSIYGSPVSYNNSMYSWYGGDGIGYVNLGLQYTYDYNYTILAFGV